MNPSPDALQDLLKSSAHRYPEHTAVLFNGKPTTFAELDELSNRAAAALAARGMAPGDTVGLYCINSAFFVVAYFGILKAGATVVPINLLLNPREVAYILHDAGARGLVYFEAFSDAVDALRAELPDLACYVRIGAPPAVPGDVPWSEVLSESAAAPAPVLNPAEHLAAIIYTSGTTGQPKGAMLTHANLAANTASIREALDMEHGRDIVLTVLPMFHAFAATAGTLAPLFSGCTVVPVPRFSPELVVQTIEASRASLFMGVPSMYSTLLKLPDEFTPRLASLRYCISGAAAMPVELMRRFEARFGKLIYEGDGPTECSPVTCCNPIGGVRKPASVGLPVPGVEMEIRDEEGRQVPTGDIGEICVRGPNVMKGYWNRPEDTREAFFGEWFRTGDLGHADEDGYFFIVDRKKDMIIVNGMNVYPRVIEEVLYRFAAVREAAVVGQPHELHGEIPVAYVALHADQDASAADIRAHCREYLGRHEVPRQVLFLDELPKNAAGKIVKRELRKQGEVERGVNEPGEDTP